MNHIEPLLYSDEQYQRIGMLDAWHILFDAYNAIQHGFIQNRLPEPGKPIDVSEAEAHVYHIEKEWEAESRLRDSAQQWTGAPAFSAMPLNAKLYLHSVLPDKISYGLKYGTAGIQTQPQERPVFFRRIMQRWIRTWHNPSH